MNRQGSFLKDKVAIVTGAGSGIGRAIAVAFARQGARVVVADIEAGDTVEHIEQIGGAGCYINTDVTNDDQVNALAESVVNRYGSIDILVNNAGITLNKTVVETTETEFDRVIGINLKGAFFMSKATLPFMIKKGRGKIVNIASVVGLRGKPARAAYSASKGGLISLTRQMAVDYGPYSININVVCPGATKTPLQDKLLQDEEYRNEYLEDIVKRTPYSRIGTVEDITDAVLFLASDHSNFINGHCLVVDGGRIIGC